VKGERGASCALTKRRDVLGISTEPWYIPLDPQKCVALVVEPEVARRFMTERCFFQEVLQYIAKQ
jgi:hypothetical protein